MDIEGVATEYGRIASKAKTAMEDAQHHRCQTVFVEEPDYAAALEPEEREYLDSVIEEWHPLGADHFLSSLYEEHNIRRVSGQYEETRPLAIPGDAVGSPSGLSEHQALIYGVGAAYEVYNEIDDHTWESGVDRLLSENSFVRSLESVHAS